MHRLNLQVIAAGCMMGIVAGCALQEQQPMQNPRLAPGTESGSFCQRLVHVLVRGTQNWNGKGYFAALAGQRIDEDRFYGKVNLGGASECVIDSSMGKFDVDYVCYYGQANEVQRGVLVKKMNELEAAIDECLVQVNTFDYVEGNVSKARYFAPRRDYDSVRFTDRWRNQSVVLRIQPVEQDENLSELILNIDSL